MRWFADDGAGGGCRNGSWEIWGAANHDIRIRDWGDHRAKLFLISRFGVRFPGGVPNSIYEESGFRDSEIRFFFLLGNRENSRKIYSALSSLIA
jgi:hypothetical protein